MLAVELVAESDGVESEEEFAEVGKREVLGCTPGARSSFLR